MSFVALSVAASSLAVTPGPGIAYVVARTAAGKAEGGRFDATNITSRPAEAALLRP
jgi:threonine/homoserine/homoserine lactone efflux protein